MSDYIVRATAADANIRAFAVTSREMVETAREDDGGTWQTSFCGSHDGSYDEGR